jgi:uncharacterized glyoxalase superfamily protein PhnB
MTTAIPQGHEGLIPHLVCDPCAKAIEFYQQAFNAELVSSVPAPGGAKIMHAEIRIDGRPLFLVDDFPEFCEGKSETPKALGGTPVTIHRFVENCDAAIDRAVKAGATLKMPPADMFWGDRYGVITDPFGHNWSLATHQQDLTPEQVAKNMEEAFAQMGA